MIFCEQCGNQLNDNAKFCGKCGTPVGAVQEETPETDEQNFAPAACVQCGEPLEPGEAFCANCGARVDVMPQQYQQAAGQANVEFSPYEVIECNFKNKYTVFFACSELKGETKEEIIIELVDLLAYREMLLNRDEVLRDVFEREKKMSTGMKDGVAIPHSATNGTNEFMAVVGIKKEGLNFGSLDGQKSRLFILTIYPLKEEGKHLKFFADISLIFKDDVIRESIIYADAPEEIAEAFREAF